MRDHVVGRAVLLDPAVAHQQRAVAPCRQVEIVRHEHELLGQRQQQVADALEEDAEVLSNTQLEQQLEGQPPEIQAEILRINDDARPEALQVALLIPALAGLIGLFNSLRMARLPDPLPSGAEHAVLG